MNVRQLAEELATKDAKSSKAQKPQVETRVPAPSR
jgi:hypothetical protein